MSFFTRLDHPQRIRFSPCEPAGTVLPPLCLMMISGLLTDWFNDGFRIAFTALIRPCRVAPTGVAVVRFHSRQQHRQRRGAGPAG